MNRSAKFFFSRPQKPFSRSFFFRIVSFLTITWIVASEKHSSLKLYSLVPSSPTALPVFLLIWVSLRNARLTPSIPAGRRVLCSSESAPVRGRLVQLFVHHPCEKADKNACLYQTFPQVATESLRKVEKKGTIT